ncbi:dihydrolipoyl dehydrogenase family protein [Aurantiacibacter spongiae]|uniref:FAD-binding protein n=1 Tax=Aurantiacibacter spongiae TaxID=2488860 RepID=A0A3N5CRV6_9SPHN|nr:FAD-dependent oxidoreductase [Aurantiacibacter spongiae]RPF71883.1 FAD-binding protein [Aurantiacibacter spongiae]
MDYSHDVIVIGGGAAGLTAAGGCALFGLRVALIESGAMGGECLNTGCVPSKALIAAAARAAEARVEERAGVTIAAPDIDWRGVRAFVRRAIADIAPHDSQDRFEDMGCEVIREHARLTGPKTVEAGGRTLCAPRIVVATGSEPAVPPVEGLAQVPYLTNETLFDLDERPEHLVILGGGNVGMEMAQAFRRLGSDVTVIEANAIMGRDDRDSVAVLVAAMKAEGVAFVQGKVNRVSRQGGGVSVEVGGGTTLLARHLLVATGRRARTGGLGLEELGIAMGDNGIAVDARRRSSLKHIYAIGDCRDGPRLTHVSAYEGSNVALEIALGVPARVDWRALPWCTYTSPEVAQVGLTESEARKRYGDRVTVVREPFDDNERAIAEGRTRGHIKLMLKGKKVVGASICGERAGELLLPIGQLITGKASTFALGSAVVAYPTRAEILKAAAFSAWEPTVFGTCPRRWAGLVQKMRRAR